MNKSKDQLKPINAADDERSAFFSLQRNQLQAEQVLSKLEAMLREHAKAVEEMRIRCSRAQEEARIFVTREFNCLSSNAERLAEALIAGGATPADLMKLVSTDRLALDRLYLRLNLKEPDDLKMIKTLDTERAAVEVLRRAIALQKGSIAELRKKDMAAVNRALGDARRKLARAVLAAVEEFNSSALVEHERDLVERLQPSEMEFLEPAPFPKRFLSLEIVQWLNQCVAMGLIEATEISELPAPLARA